MCIRDGVGAEQRLLIDACRAAELLAIVRAERRSGGVRQQQRAAAVSGKSELFEKPHAVGKPPRRRIVRVFVIKLRLPLFENAPAAKRKGGAGRRKQQNGKQPPEQQPRKARAFGVRPVGRIAVFL